MAKLPNQNSHKENTAQKSQTTAKIVSVIEKIPYKFWVIFTLAMCAGLFSIFIMQAYGMLGSKTTKSNYPLYERTQEILSEKQPEFIENVTGSWYLKKDAVEMLLELYDDGYFQWHIIDLNNKYIKLFGAGLYAIDEQDRLLFSQRQDLGLPFDPQSPATRVSHIDLLETPFTFSINAQKDMSKSMYVNVPDAAEATPRVRALLKTLAGQQEYFILRYLGAPALRENR